MIQQFVQSVDQWPRRDFIARARLAIGPVEIAQRCGIQFMESYDDLEYFDGAMFRLSGGNYVRLMRYRGDSKPGTDICFPKEDKSYRETIHYVLAELEIDPLLLVWICSDEPEKPAGDS